MFDWFKDLTRRARLAPPKPGPMGAGSFRDQFGTDRVFLIAIDGRGRVFQVLGATVDDGNFVQIGFGRSSVIHLMDLLGVEDLTPEEIAEFARLQTER